MNTPHKHAEVIKAWADGAEIEFRDPDSPSQVWQDAPYPAWVDDLEYRVKPEPKRYKVDVWLVFNSNGVIIGKYFYLPLPQRVDEYDYVVHQTLEGEIPNE